MCKINLTDIIRMEDGKPPNMEILERLTNDPSLLVDVLYAVCKDEADRHGITPEQFGYSMGGEAVESATAALLEEILDFFPEARRRIIRPMLQARRRLAERLTINLAEAVEARLNQLTGSLQNLPDV